MNKSLSPAPWFVALLLLALSPTLSFSQEEESPSAPSKPAVPAQPSKTVSTMPEKSSFHLYLLIGQSNMVGRGALDAESSVPHPRVLMLNKDNQWVMATDPLHFAKPGKDTVGPGFSFGKALADKNPSVTVGLIPCAVGGTPLSRWVKGAPLYTAAVVRAHEAMKNGELKGVIWHQGEADSKKEDTATTYATRLTGMIADLRSELGKPGLPVVVGELGDFLDDINLPFWKKVNGEILTVSQSVPHCGLAKSGGLKNKGDHLHFNTEAEREFGRRYAEEMERLQKTP